MWTQPELPRFVNKDHGVFFKDANVGKNPSQPYEPMVRAIAATSGGGADLAGVDVIVNRTALIQLFKFAKGSPGKNFKVDVNLVANTLFVTGRQRKNREDVASEQHRGEPSWGHSFEDAFTRYGPGAEGSTSHQRAIRYRFGNLTFLVRHEVDAAYGPDDSSEDPLAAAAAASASATDATGSAGRGGPGKKGDPKSLLNLMMNGKARVPGSRSQAGNAAGASASLRTQEANVAWANSFVGNGRGLRTEVRQGGSGTSPSDLIELKARPNMPVYLAIPQMWFGRTPHLIKGIHAKGHFSSVEHTGCVPEYEKWEQRNQEGLQKLAALFSELRRLAAANDKALVGIVRRDDKEVMELWTPTYSRMPIPMDLARIYWFQRPGGGPRYPQNQHQRQPQRQNQRDHQRDAQGYPSRGHPRGPPRGPPRGHPSGSPGYPPRGPSGYPAGGSSGYPPRGSSGYAPRGHSGYPPRGPPRHPPSGPSGYPPSGPPGYPPSGPPGYSPRDYSGYPPRPPPGGPANKRTRY